MTDEEKSMYIGSYGATSFAELFETQKAAESAARINELAELFPMLASNIIASDEIENKEQALTSLAQEFTALTDEAMKQKDVWQPLTDKLKNIVGDFVKAESKTEGGVSYPASDFAYVPDRTKPSTWKLRLAEGRPGNITKAQLGRAAAAFSSGGFRGNKVQLPSSAVSQVKARIRREYSKLGVSRDEMPDAVKENAFTIWHDKERDQWRWFAIYSNKYRDDDNPPEIISDASHRHFVKSVESGDTPYPELWLWHVPNSRVGQSDWLAYTDEGFALASGYFDSEYAQIAKSLSEIPDLATSHGMPPQYIERDSDDETVIVKHVTREISPLPYIAAANKLTSFEILTKEKITMSIPDDKREFLMQAGLTAEQIEAIESTVKSKAQDAEGLEYKETEQEQETEQEIVQEQEQDETPQPMTTEQVLETVIAAVAPLVDKVKSLENALAQLQKDDDTKVKERVLTVPKASAAAIAQERVKSLFGKETQIDGRSSLAKSGPKQTETDQPQGLFFQNWTQPSAEQ